jgi:hypothetical protein
MLENIFNTIINLNSYKYISFPIKLYFLNSLNISYLNIVLKVYQILIELYFSIYLKVNKRSIN